MKPRCPALHRIHPPIGEGGSYRRLFDLPALDADEAVLRCLGTVGGFCDGGDRNAESKTAAGWPLFGQYVAHDLTADRSPLRAHADLAALRNMRSPRANLESLYGGGPVGLPYLYQRDDPAKLLENDGDLPRNQEKIALIADPRNDPHVLISQMQVAFIGAHNMIVDRLRDDRVAEAELYDEARRALVWHYQWLIVNEFLPGVVGPELVAELGDTGPRFYRAEPEPFIPVEFADAAYRYGHSQIRELYRLQPGGRSYRVFPDLIGFGPVGERRVDWSLFFDVPGRPPAQRATPMNGVLPRSLIELPEAITGAVDDVVFRSLAARDLQRGHGTGLPSGEAVGRLLGAELLTEDELGLRGSGWEGETPLWLYVLRESFVRHNGDRLGEVGGRIVAEVIYGVILADSESYLSLDPDWKPTLPSRGDRFRLVDILAPDREVELTILGRTGRRDRHEVATSVS